MLTQRPRGTGLAEHLKERRVTSQPATRIQRILGYIMSLGTPKATRRKAADIPEDFEIVQTTTFNKIRSIPIFEQISPRAHLDVNFEDTFQSPRLMEMLQQHLYSTKSTKVDYFERLMTVESNDNADEYFGILEPLFHIIRQDALSLIKLLHDTLDHITVEILDEMKMEENLSLWRELITRAQLELPELRHSMVHFFSFFHLLDPGMDSASARAEQNSDGNISRGFQDVSQQIDQMLHRLSQASMSLTSNMALLDSRRSIAEAQAVTKLTELAFFFIPLTFAASLFGMQIEQFENRAPLSTFIALGVGFTALSYMVRLLI